MDGSAPVSSNYKLTSSSLPCEHGKHSFITTWQASFCFDEVHTSSCVGVSLILSIWMCCSVFLQRVASSVFYIWCFSCATSSCCPYVKQLSSQLSISFHHSLLSSSKTLIKQLCGLRLTLLSRTQIIKWRLWLHSGAFVGIFCGLWNQEKLNMKFPTCIFHFLFCRVKGLWTDDWEW